jgi:hypothetical protein
MAHVSLTARRHRSARRWARRQTTRCLLLCAPSGTAITRAPTLEQTTLRVMSRAPTLMRTMCTGALSQSGRLWQSICTEKHSRVTTMPRGTWACAGFMRIRRNPDHSDFHVTLKLPPSDARAEGAAVTLLPFSPVLVEMDSCTALRKSVIGPETEPSVAVSVPPLTPV